MHSASWQAVCGFFTDVYESLDRDDISMRHIFEVICQNDNDRYALWMENGKKSQINYGELPKLCSSAAYQMDMLVAEKSGIVALHMCNAPAWPILFWAILMSGHTPLLLNAALPLQTYERIIGQSGAVAVISCDDEAGAIHPKCLLNNDVQADMALFEDRWEDRVIFMTSGTTGTPKLVVFNGKSIAKQVQSCRYFYRETTELVYPKSNGSLRQLALLPFSHIFGFTICVIWYPCFGKQIVYPPSQRLDDVISTCQNMRITHLCAVPSYFDAIVHMMLNAAKGLFGKHADGFISYLKTGGLQEPELFQRYQNFAKKLCAYVLGGDIRYLISGGGMLSHATAAFYNRLGLRLCNGYGMTELGILSVEKSEIPEKRMQASIGNPSYGVVFSIDSAGELLVDCDYSAIGYLEDGGITPLEKPFPTKDLARRLPDGRYVLLGRSDDILIDSDGNRVHPNEIEENLCVIPRISGACVISCDKKLVAILESSAVDRLDEISAGINRANSYAPLSHFVHEAWLCKKLPRTQKGEVNRREMADRYPDDLIDAVKVPVSRQAVGVELSAPLVCAIQKKVAEILLVSEEKILPNANFFSELGMDSLAYMCLVRWLEEEYRMPFINPDQQRFDTVYQCVEYIQRGGKYTV